MELEVRERAGELRCGFCREAVGEADSPRECASCPLVLHAECWEEVGGCPACRPAAASSALRVRARRRVPPRRPRVRCYRCAERLGDDYELCPGCGWAFHPLICFEDRRCCLVGQAEREWAAETRQARAPSRAALTAWAVGSVVAFLGACAFAGGIWQWLAR